MYFSNNKSLKKRKIFKDKIGRISLHYTIKTHTIL